MPMLNEKNNAANMRMDDESKHNLVRLKNERGLNLEVKSESVITQEVHSV